MWRKTTFKILSKIHVFSFKIILQIIISFLNCYIVLQPYGLVSFAAKKGDVIAITIQCRIYFPLEGTIAILRQFYKPP